MVKPQPVLIEAVAGNGPAGVWGRAEAQDNAAVAQQNPVAKFSSHLEAQQAGVEVPGSELHRSP